MRQTVYEKVICRYIQCICDINQGIQAGTVDSSFDKAEAEAVLKKLLARGMSADEILEKLK